MKTLRIFILGLLLISLGCQEGYIDSIKSVDPGTDESAPSVTLSYPPGDITIPFTNTETDINFEFSASDDIELRSISIALDGSELATYDNFIDYRKSSESFLSENVPIGDHTVRITAADLTGKSTTNTLNFKVTNQYVAKDGEIFYMPFEGEVYLDLISETEGEPSGNVTFANGISGKAASFDATSQSYLLFPGTAFSEVENFTLSFWVNVVFIDTDKNGSNDGILGLVNLSNVGRFWGNLDFFVENESNPTTGANMKLHITNGAESPAVWTETWIENVTDVPDLFGNWTNHVLTYDNGSKKFNYFINGELMTTTAAGWDTDLDFQDNGPMVFGCVQFQTNPSLTTTTGAQDWASYLTGELDEIRIFNKVLSSSEVEDLYNEVN